MFWIIDLKSSFFVFIDFGWVQFYYKWKRGLLCFSIWQLVTQERWFIAFFFYTYMSLLLHFSILPQIPLGIYKRAHQSITDMIDVLRATFISCIIPYFIAFQVKMYYVWNGFFVANIFKSRCLNFICHLFLWTYKRYHCIVLYCS